MKNESIFLRVFNSKISSTDISRPPVWFMRQAGRALSSYRALKENHDFVELLRDPQLATDVTLLPQEALGIDALILFTDILVIPEAMGVEVDYGQGGPQMLSPLKQTKGRLPSKKKKKILENVYRTITIVKEREKNLPLIGFCGGPLTVFLYLYQGSGHGGDFSEALDFFYNEPEQTEKILETITEASIDYALGQVHCGVDAFQIFETWANVIPSSLYIERILPYVVTLSKKIHQSIPLIFFPRFFSNGYELLQPYLENFSGIGIDYLNNLETLSSHFSTEMVIQGNLDPTMVKYSSKKNLNKYLDHYLSFFQHHRRWIVNLGHGVLPGTPEENLKLIVDRVKNMDS